ncbi:MAG: protein kinase, partial [Chloroflexota bacterium]
HDLAMLHLTESPPPPRQVYPALSPGLEAVLLKTLAKSPEDRFASGAALADALEQALQAALNAAEPDAGRKAIIPAAVAAAAPAPPAADDLPTLTGSPAPAPAKEGQVVTTRYLLKNIRALLIELMVSMTEAELRQLCVDLPDFKPVHQQLAQRKGKAEIIDRLLEYAEQTLQLTELLSLVKELDPVLYKKHQPYYESVSVGRRNLVGKSLGQYHLVERLGQGGMADVYKAYQPSLARYVAIKIVHGHLADDDEFLERFEREAIAVAGLHHPNIVQVFDFAREDDLYYMVMEFIDGPTLEAELRAHRDNHKLLPLAETVALFQALASAIDYAHNQKVVHRDLKPANIMFAPDRRVVLADFGIARLLSVPGYTTKNAVLGTPAYMSPEQAQGEPVDRRSDIYSLGVILYELVTGRVPYEGDNPMAILVELVTGAWPSPTSINPHLPAPVEQVVLRAMRQNPDERYQAAGELAQALQQAFEAGQKPRALANRNQNVHSAIPEIEVKLPSAGADLEGLWRDLAQAAGGRVPLSNRGQVALGGQNVIQIGAVSGGQISLGLGGSQPQPAEPAPRLEELRTVVRQQLVDLKAQLGATLPPDKQQTALERVDELGEALTATPPDLDTVVYVKGWLAKNSPTLATTVAGLLAQPAVAQLMAAAGESVLAEFRRRLG